MQRELGESYEALLSQIKTGSVTPEKVRDVTLIPLVGDVKLVIACDSNASIGEKKNDYYKNAYEEVAVSAMKVPLMEVLATGAVPVVVVDNLCMEMEGAGKRIISIMRRQLEEAGLSNVQLTGSTEDNMPTTQSGFGVTAIGLLQMQDCRIASTRRGDRVVCVGVPRSGVKNERYSEYDRDTAKISTVCRLAGLPYVHEILPVGSKCGTKRASLPNRRGCALRRRSGRRSTWRPPQARRRQCSARSVRTISESSKKIWISVCSRWDRSVE